MWRKADVKLTAKYLETARKKYEGGAKAAVLMALHHCFLMKKPVPVWLRRAFVEAYESAAHFEIRSWDEAFGPPLEKGVHLGARKEYADLRFPVALRVALRAPNEKLEPDFFDKIGCELGVGKNKANDAYYKFGGKELAEAIKPLVPFLRELILRKSKISQED